MERTPINSSMGRRYEYFDPGKPAIPDQVFGVSSDRLLDIAPVAGALAFEIPYEGRGYIVGAFALTLEYKTEDVLRVAPLIERMAAGEQLTPADVRPYRKSIKSLAKRNITGLAAADRLLAASVIGLPLRARLNRRIEREFIRRMPQMIEQAREALRTADPQIKQYVEWARNFEKAQAQPQPTSKSRKRTI